MRDLVTEIKDFAFDMARMQAEEAKLFNGQKPMFVEIDSTIPVITVLNALASSGLTIYCAPYADATPIITTAARANEFRRQVRESEAARDRENASGMEP